MRRIWFFVILAGFALSLSAVADDSWTYFLDFPNGRKSIEMPGPMQEAVVLGTNTTVPLYSPDQARKIAQLCLNSGYASAVPMAVAGMVMEDAVADVATQTMTVALEGSDVPPVSIPGGMRLLKRVGDGKLFLGFHLDQARIVYQYLTDHGVSPEEAAAAIAGYKYVEKKEGSGVSCRLAVSRMTATCQVRPS